MGLFDKKLCTICGKKKGLFGYKLADGNYLCADCADKYAHNALFDGAKYHKKYTPSDLTLTQYQDFVAMRENNLYELEEFSPSKTFLGFIHIDEDAQEMVISEGSVFSNKKKLMESNPPVFEFENLAFVRVVFSAPEESTTLTGKAKVESQIRIILGFVDPLYDIICINAGKMVTKDSMFGIKTTVNPEIKELMHTIDDMISWEISWSADNDVMTPAADMDAYWKLAKRAKDLGYLSGDDIRECLRNYYGKDRARIREVKKTYGL